MNPAIRQWLHDSFARRACFICGLFKWCQHREPLVEIAALQAESKYWLAGTVNKETPEDREPGREEN